MLAFLLDEHISHVVMQQLREKHPDLRVESVLRWREGGLRGKADELLLIAAAEENLTLVTYDQKTITPLIVQWAMEGRRHAGVIFIDEKTIAPEDIGGKVMALFALWQQSHTWDWSDAVAYLRPA